MILNWLRRKKDIPEVRIRRLPIADPDGRYVNVEDMRGSMLPNHQCNTACMVDIARHWVNR